MSSEIHLTNTTLVVTLRCNLRCKLCAVSAPYYKNPPHYSVEVLKKSIERFFEAVDYVDKFTINGGEPFVHAELSEVVDYLRQYEDRITMTEIITNGSLMPNDRLAESLAKTKSMNVLIDDYGKELSANVDSMITLFEEKGIQYRRRKYYGEDAHLGGWVDLTNVCKKERSAKETSEIYKKCAYPGPFHCFVLIGGNAYICGVYKRCLTEGIIEDKKDEYVEFLGDDWDVETARAKIASFYDRDYFSACEFCDGFCMDSKRYAPAEQLKEAKWKI